MSRRTATQAGVLRIIADASQPITSRAVAEIAGMALKTIERKCAALSAVGHIAGFKRLQLGVLGEPPTAWHATDAGKHAIQWAPSLPQRIVHNSPAQQYSIGWPPGY